MTNKCQKQIVSTKKHNVLHSPTDQHLITDFFAVATAFKKD